MPENFSVLAAACSLMGCFMTAILPVGMDLSVEITFPVPEGITASLLMCSAQIFGIAFTLALTYLMQWNLSAANWFLTAWAGFAALLFLFFRGENKRLQSEQSSKASGEHHEPQQALVTAYRQATTYHAI